MANQVFISEELSTRGGFISCTLNDNLNQPNISIRRPPGPNALPNLLDLQNDVHLANVIAWMLSFYKDDELRNLPNPFMIDQNGYGFVTFETRQQINGLNLMQYDNVRIRFPVDLANVLRMEPLDPELIRRTCLNINPNYFENIQNLLQNRSIYRIPQEFINELGEENFDDDNFDPINEDEDENNGNQQLDDLQMVYYGVQFFVA